MNFIEENLIPVLALTIAFGLPAVIVSIYYKYESNRDRLFHESLQLLITSGQGVTPENLRGIPGFKEIAPRNDVRRGRVNHRPGSWHHLFRGSWPRRF